MQPFLGFHEPVSSLNHLFVALVVLFIGPIMVWRAQGNVLRRFSLFIYVFSNIFLFSMSGVYHLLQKGTDANYVLQILDHAGIFLLIAGTFTPLHIILLRGASRWVPLVSIWVLAIVGITLGSIFFSDMPEWLFLTLFISMGWMGTYGMWAIRKVDPKTTWLVLIGGVFYTVGALIDFAKLPALITGHIGSHEIFHFFITAAAAVHFYGVWRISKVPSSAKLTLVVKKRPDKVTAKFTSEGVRFVGSSVDEVKTAATNWVKDHFPSLNAPSLIRVKIYNEEDVHIS